MSFLLTTSVKKLSTLLTGILVTFLLNGLASLSWNFLTMFFNLSDCSYGVSSNSFFNCFLIFGAILNRTLFLLLDNDWLKLRSKDYFVVFKFSMERFIVVEVFVNFLWFLYTDEAVYNWFWRKSSLIVENAFNAILFLGNISTLWAVLSKCF